MAFSNWAPPPVVAVALRDGHIGDHPADVDGYVRGSKRKPVYGGVLAFHQKIGGEGFVVLVNG